MNVDLTNCDREPIHLLGHVQSFGCLIALSPDWLVLHASRNVEEHLGIPVENLIGTPFRDVVSPETLHEIRGEVQTLTNRDAIARIYNIALLGGEDDRRFNLSMHESGRALILEIEPASPAESSKDHLGQVRTMIEGLKACSSVEQLCQVAARFVRGLCGFDRVMVYRFASDDTGQVIAEAAGPGIDSFMGLRYPASDIPRQARELYKRSLIRIISNVNDRVSPIVPETNSEKEPLDLSLSTLRAVSPIHLEYLRNMGVDASMSISILQDGKLWGLFACHHYEPRILDYRVRTSCDLFAQMFGFVLAQVETRRRNADAETARHLHDRLMRHFAEGGHIADDFNSVVDGLAELISFDGAAGWIDGKYQTVGSTPTQEETMQLVRFLNTTATSRVYATDYLQGVFPPAADYTSRASGVMALPVSRKPRDYIILFRGEVAKSVNWAGNPEKAVELGPNGVRLTPRKSFETWQQVVQGQSAEWTDSELQVAEAIRVTLLEVVLRMSDAANLDRTRAQEKQELLIAELNHRVRNILNLIRGLVDQSKAGATSVSEFTRTVGDRINALARAHDQITREAWAASSLRELVLTELQAYLGIKCDRAHFHGVDAIIKPEAFSTIALVVHELTTNSAKYGALSDRSGAIDITVHRAADDSLIVNWVESGGPPVKPPLRRGFGSTVIERSIPFELGGDAEIHYPITGVTARLCIPARHIARFTEKEEDSTPVPSPRNIPNDGPALHGSAMLVEDNIIIAMDGESFLRELGADEVHVASSVSEAKRVIEATDLTCAVLDLNLGGENSLPIAAALRDKGVPFAFATGYGDASDMLSDFPEAPVLTKPYEKASLARVLQSLITADS